jgi:hypothetical protein
MRSTPVEKFDDLLKCKVDRLLILAGFFGSRIKEKVQSHIDGIEIKTIEEFDATSS